MASPYTASLATRNRLRRCGNDVSPKQLVILRMGPDPEPDKSIGRFNCECAIPITYSD